MNRSTLKRHLFLLVAGCAIGCAAGENFDTGKAPGVSAESPTERGSAGSSSLPAEDGAARSSAQREVTLSAISLSQLDEHIAREKGNVVVLDIWSTNCVPCMKEFHHLVELSQRSPDELKCMSLNVDYIGLPKRPPQDYVPAVEEFLQKKQAATVQNYLSTDADSDVLEKYGVEAMPAILVFNREGELVARLTDANASGEGVTYAADVVPLVENLLKSE